MKELVVKEQVRIRFYNYVEDVWGKWEDTSDDFEIACQKAKDKVEKNSWTTYQVAKFYYDLNGNYIAWNDGAVFN